MKALVFERKVARYAASRLASTIKGSGSGAKLSPISFQEIGTPDLPGEGWHELDVVLSGICGSDLATIDGRSSRYYEDIVSFPFVPGHEIVAKTKEGSRVVIEPVLHCATRSIQPLCSPCSEGNTQLCQNLAFGDLEPGLQTGYCSTTLGGWGPKVLAHESQIHEVPDNLSDEEAVLVEPMACSVHAALKALGEDGAKVAVIGAGTLGLGVIAALSQFCPVSTIIAAAKYPHQQRMAKQLGAEVVVGPSSFRDAIRRASSSMMHGPWLTAGADITFDCVGSSSSISEALQVTKPGGRIVMVGMPGPTKVDLAPFWHREIKMEGSYAYGTESLGNTFKLAMEMIAAKGLGALVSAKYPLHRYEEAIRHAAQAGGRDGVKVVFEITTEKSRR